MMVGNRILMTDTADGSLKSRFLRDNSFGLGKKSAGLLVLGVVVLFLSTGVMAQSSSDDRAVSIGQNGIEMFIGTLDVNGNDIVSSGTTIWDASAGEVPSDVVGIDLANSAGSFLTWNSNNEELNVDGDSIQSGTTASDVGLENVQNEAQVAQDGDTMTGDLEFETDTSLSYPGDGNNNKLIMGGGLGDIELTSDDGNFDVGVSSVYLTTANAATESEVGVKASEISLDEDTSTDDDCVVTNDADWECDGSKNWVHQMNSSHEAVYTSQEGPDVRAVYEETAAVENGSANVSLPGHFSETVSDSRPDLKAQATPDELATVAVTEKTDDYIVIEASEDVEVDYRVTGIREGYEDKQVVRPKEER